MVIISPRFHGLRWRLFKVNVKLSLLFRHVTNEKKGEEVDDVVEPQPQPQVEQVHE